MDTERMRDKRSGQSIKCESVCKVGKKGVINKMEKV